MLLFKSSSIFENISPCCLNFKKTYKLPFNFHPLHPIQPLRLISIQCNLASARNFAIAAFRNVISRPYLMGFVLLDNTHFKRKRSHKIKRSLNCTEWKSAFTLHFPKFLEGVPKPEIIDILRWSYNLNLHFAPIILENTKTVSRRQKNPDVNRRTNICCSRLCLHGTGFI